MEVRREVQRNLDLMDGQCGKGEEGQRGREINGLSSLNIRTLFSTFPYDNR